MLTLAKSLTFQHLASMSLSSRLKTTLVLASSEHNVLQTVVWHGLNQRILTLLGLKEYTLSSNYKRLFSVLWHHKEHIGKTELNQFSLPVNQFSMGNNLRRYINPSSTNIASHPPGKSKQLESDVCIYGKYCSNKLLNKGSFGKTILAYKPDDPKRYTLKVIPHERMHNSNEVNILHDLQGIPNIVQYVEHFNAAQDLIIVCEYCEGAELFDYIYKHGRLSESVAKDVFRQLCTAMIAAHKKGIIHRDLKPENIIIDDDKVTIIDWGLAFYPDRTIERASCGSPNYASPEVISGYFYDGPEVDVWSLGCVLYIILTARFPFNNEYIPALFDKIRKCQVDYPEDVPDEAIDLLKQIFVRENRLTLEGILASQWLSPVEGWYFSKAESYIENTL